MSENRRIPPSLQPEQEAIRARYFHPTGQFVGFPKEDVERSVPERFEKIVRMHPERVAVKTSNDTVTYAQLNAMANRMAHALVELRGVEAEAVAILLEKGPKLMAAMLAVLKAGKYFVLLDRSLPQARVQAVLEDSQAALIVCDRSDNEALGNLRLFSSAPIILESEAVFTNGAETNLDLAITPHALAVVVYTSGSTGDPKGVMRTQRNLLHATLLFTNAYKLTNCDRLLLTTSGTANALTIGFLALLNGAALLPFDVRSQGVGMLKNWIVEEKITICWMGTPLFRSMCRALDGDKLPSHVRVLRLSSEVSFNSDIQLYKQHFSPDCLLFNGLSATEAGLICLYPIDFNSELGGQDVPVGYPVEDKEILLLDDSGRKVGCNELGEIVIRSRYLSVGYWRQPVLTASKFRPDPDNDGQRIYYSGDLGIRLPDGSLIHKGRKDFRVKIRGYGVELAEAEKVLASHPSVRQAVVVAPTTETGEARLVAYFTRTDSPAPTVSELRDFLKTRLPDFMIPSAFVLLETIPLTHSGKIDRRALPAPANARSELDVPYVAPQSDIEEQLAQIWKEILDIHPIGIHDNFFDLGGHSLSASRLASRVIRNFQLEIPLQSLFESSTVAEMAALITKQQKGRSAAEDGAVTAITASILRPTPRNIELPLSFAQQRLWFLHQLEPDSPVYNQFKALRLRGRLNRQALQKALDTIVERHEVLRTTFSSVDGEPTQVIHAPGTVEIIVVDLLSIPIEQQEEALDRLMSEITRRPFDLEKDWPLRTALIRLANDEHVLLLVTHHIASDGWSNDILFRELSALYEAFYQGKASPLEDLRIQYADYAVWQKEWLQGELLEQQLSYWKKQLEDISPLELPTDHPRPEVQGYLGRTKTFTFPQTLAESLKALSRQEGVTLFMTLLAAFQTLLHRYTAQDDIAVGCPIAGRSRVEIEGLIGFFVNTLVLRNDFSGNPTFRQLLGKIRKNALDAYSHQDVPFEKLVEDLRPARDLSRNPFFQVSFQLRNYPKQTVSLGDLAIEEIQFDIDIAKFDLSVGLRDDETGLSGSVEYRIDLFDPTTIERMIGHFQTLLDGIVADPNRRIGELPLLSEGERHQLLVEWNDTKREYAKDKCIHELFEEQVEKTPDAVAVVFEEEQITYRELNHRSNQLAHYLQKLGVGPDTLVVLFMERSLELVIGILGVLKAGGAYLPVDPDLPTERLQFLLQKSHVRLLLTQDKLHAAVADFAGSILSLDSERSRLSDRDRDNPQSKALGHHAAYVIYTSGSTGTPKGVVNIHDGLRNRIQWMQQAYRLTASDRILQKTPYTFDVSVWEFLWPLSCGARLVLAQPGGQRDSAYLVELIRTQQITTIHFVPSMLDVFLREAGIEQCTSLRQVFCSGEALPSELQQRFFERSPVALHNLYGPTEASIDVTSWECPRDRTTTAVPIGRPIANTQIYILDARLQPVPVGVSGELHIGGVGLAQGYLNRPDLTQEKFIPNPFSDQPGARLYKTGDLARYLPDGNIEFLGRIDNQIKLRGYRIELGEIESVLAQHPAIQQAVVLAREDTSGDRRLVAYAVNTAGLNPSAQDLRRFLQQKLPEYMVPSAFMFLDLLPLTANGKLDRKALPAPDQSRPELNETFTAPTTPVEEILANIWSEVLKLDKVGIHDNFFHLGGHSLLATQVVSRIRDTFKLDLPLRSLFEAPTIQGLAQKLYDLGNKLDAAKTVRIAPLARDQYRIQSTN